MDARPVWGTFVVLVVCAGLGSCAQPGAVPVTSSTVTVCTRSTNAGGFGVSLVKDTGGEPSPELAAAWFISHGGIWSKPDGGWQRVDSDESGVTVTSERSYLHTVQGPDQTWFVDSGYRCEQE